MSRAALALLLVLAASAARAQQPAASPAPSEPGLEDLLQILEEETAVATRTRMNNDFVPGVVTVLHGDELEALGYETVAEALALVPGIQATRDREGVPSAVVRGIDFPFNSGNIKVLVNGVPLSRDNAGVNQIVLQTPVQQVDRVEIIRGPGSVVHGDFAFLGLVNIVTRSAGTRAWARAGSSDVRALGGHVARRAAGWDLALGVAGWHSSEAPAPDPLTVSEDRGFATFQAEKGGFALTAQVMARDLDPRGTTTLDAAQEHWAVETRYGRAVRAVHVEGRAALRNNDVRTPGNNFRGDVLELGLHVSGDAGKRHHWLAGAAFQRNDITSALFRVPPRPGVPTPAPVPVNDESRRVVSLLAQDRFDVSPSLALTAGARLDDDEHVGTRLTPRVALVWRASDRHILKAQHSEGFRPPTFFELYAATGRPAEGLDFEVNATTELNYVHRRPRAVWRATAFRTSLRDMIYTVAPRVFANSAEARASGVELEWEQQVGSKVRLLSNLSFVDEEETRTPDRSEITSPLAARWLANAAVLFRPAPRALLSAHWNHVGERGTAAVREDGWDTVDVTARLGDEARRGFTVAGGVRNVLDDEVVYLVATQGGVQRNVFPGRSFWFQVAWERP